ncbi:entry exclusion protein TrbK [Rhizobium hainanense]|uniref:entry exclusion protein TrbK n=1 Tax=Rhizobium hainanense TaxID=52131 RepID=UPI00313C4CA2
MAILLAAAAASTITVLVMRSESSEPAGMSHEQRSTREKFFGADKELPPIEKGQEMRPRW